MLVPQTDGGIVISESQDVEPILEYAKERARAGLGNSPTGELRELAHFPDVIVLAYCKAMGIDFTAFMHDPQHVKNLLADPALRDFQVHANNPHKLWR